MPKHIANYDNKNRAIVADNYTLERSYFNRVFLAANENFSHSLAGFESCIVVVSGSCDIRVGADKFMDVGQRPKLFEGKADSVYLPLGARAELQGKAPKTEIYIAAGRAEKAYQSFRIRPEDVDTVQYGSDETKTHRKIYHILGQKQAQQVDKLLVSELFTVGAGGWSGFPPHKHHQDRLENGRLLETDHEEIYHFKFNPAQGFGAQFAYLDDDDYGPVYHLKDGSTVLLDKGYHPVVVAPGYEMYYFTILVGKGQRPLVQHFQAEHSYQLKTIPGIMDMVNKFK